MLSRLLQRSDTVARFDVVPLLVMVVAARYPPKSCTRPSPESLVNSASDTPTLRNRHSSASEPPVAMAILGRFPSLLLRGRRVRSVSVMAVFTQAGTLA